VSHCLNLKEKKGNMKIKHSEINLS